MRRAARTAAWTLALAVALCSAGSHAQQAQPDPQQPAQPVFRTGADEESEAARDDVRLFAIFLDDYHVRKENSLRVRAPLQQFVQTQLGPTDMIGLMYPLE